MVRIYMFTVCLVLLLGMSTCVPVWAATPSASYDYDAATHYDHSLDSDCQSTPPGCSYVALEHKTDCVHSESRTNNTGLFGILCWSSIIVVGYLSVSRDYDTPSNKFNNSPHRPNYDVRIEPRCTSTTTLKNDMSQYRAYFTPGGMDPSGTDIQSAAEDALGIRMVMELLTVAPNQTWHVAEIFLPESLEYKWSIHPDSLIVFNNKRIKQATDQIKKSLDLCGSGVGVYSGVKDNIQLNKVPMTNLEYFLGTTSIHWRATVTKPWFGMSGCCNPLHVHWTFWIDDDIDANSFWDKDQHGNLKFSGLVDGKWTWDDFPNMAEGTYDLVGEKVLQNYISFKAQTFERYMVCCD